MTKFEYLVDLRSRIIREIGDIKNSALSLQWDDTRPNSLTRKSLTKIYSIAKIRAKAFGVHIIQRHCPCGRAEHQHEYYIMSPLDGRSFSYNDPAYIWDIPIDQGEQWCRCPCTDSRDSRLHVVLNDVIFEHNADQKLCSAISSILHDIHAAVSKSGSGMPRSGVREYLLRSLLKLNDQILPQPVDAYIDQKTGQQHPPSSFSGE